MRSKTSGEGQTLREEGCATCRGVYQNRDMLLYLEMLFSSEFISDADKQDLFIYFTAITESLRTACSGRFSPQKRFSLSIFRALLLKIQNFKTIFKCRNIQGDSFYSGGLGCIFQIPDFLEKERCFRLRNNKEYFVFLGALQSRSPVGAPVPGMLLLLPLRAAASPDNPNLPRKYSSGHLKWVKQIEKCFVLGFLSFPEETLSVQPLLSQLCVRAGMENSNDSSFYLPLIKC